MLEHASVMLTCVSSSDALVQMERAMGRDKIEVNDRQVNMHQLIHGPCFVLEVKVVKKL